MVGDAALPFAEARSWMLALAVEDLECSATGPFAEAGLEVFALDVRCADKDHSGCSASKSCWVKGSVVLALYLYAACMALDAAWLKTSRVVPGCALSSLGTSEDIDVLESMVHLEALPRVQWVNYLRGHSWPAS